MVVCCGASKQDCQYYEQPSPQWPVSCYGALKGHLSSGQCHATVHWRHVQSYDVEDTALLVSKLNRLPPMQKYACHRSLNACHSNCSWAQCSKWTRIKANVYVSSSLPLGGTGPKSAISDCILFICHRCIMRDRILTIMPIKLLITITVIMNKMIQVMATHPFRLIRFSTSSARFIFHFFGLSFFCTLCKGAFFLKLTMWQPI